MGPELQIRQPGRPVPPGNSIVSLTCLFACAAGCGDGWLARCCSRSSVTRNGATLYVVSWTSSIRDAGHDRHQRSRAADPGQGKPHRHCDHAFSLKPAPSGRAGTQLDDSLGLCIRTWFRLRRHDQRPSQAGAAACLPHRPSQMSGGPPVYLPPTSRSLGSKPDQARTLVMPCQPVLPMTVHQGPQPGVRCQPEGEIPTVAAPLSTAPKGLADHPRSSIPLRDRQGSLICPCAPGS